MRHHQGSQTLPEPQRHENVSPDKPEVPQPQPTGGFKPQASYAHVYQQPSKLLINSRPPPVIVDTPIGQPNHHMLPTG